MTLEKLSNKVNPKKNIYRFPPREGKIDRQDLLTKLGEWVWWEKGRGKRKREEREGEKKLRERYSRGEKKRDILSEGAIKGIARDLAVEKFPGIHKDDPSKDPKQ